MEMSNEQIKRDLAFDAYGRHAIVKDIININKSDGERFKILDVGAGQQKFLRLLLPDDEVYTLDPYVDASDINRIEGDGCDIPLEDNSFDFVVSSDVFEHIAPSLRNAFLRENLRVARLGVILAAPFYSREIELAEIYANENYKIISKGEDHTWLKEHIENGLPREHEVEDLLKEYGYSFQKINNNDLLLWESLVLATFVNHSDTADKLRDFNLFYNDKIYPRDHEENSYRKIYFIKKKEGLKDLKLEAGGIDGSLYLETIKNNLGLFCHIYVHQKDLIERLVKETHKKQKELEQAGSELSEAQEEIVRIRSSKSWRMTRPLRKTWATGHKYTQLVKGSRDQR